MKKKTVALLLALTLVLGVVAGGTIAWLTSTSDTVTNTFTTSDIKITLTEDAGKDANYQFKMVPGWKITKDPKVKVESGSEACWLFVEVTENDVLKNYIEYSVQTGEGKWTQGKGTDTANGGDGIPTNVYYRAVTSIPTDGATFEILTNNQVTVKDSVTKTNMNDLDKEGATKPVLTFRAYACQYYKDNTTPFTAPQAWANISNPSGTTTP